MQASNKNQLTLHRKIIFREFSQISRSYYNDLRKEFPEKISKNFTIIYIQIKTDQAYRPKKIIIIMNRKPY